MAFLVQSSKVLPQSSQKHHGQVCHSNIPLSWYQFIVGLLWLWWWPKQLGEGLFVLCFYNYLFIIEGSQDRNSNRAGNFWQQELMKRPWRGAALWFGSHDLFNLLSYSSHDHHPQWAGHFPHQSPTKKMPHIAGSFLNWSSLFRWFQLVSSWHKIASTLVHFDNLEALLNNEQVQTQVAQMSGNLNKALFELP